MLEEQPPPAWTPGGAAQSTIEACRGPGRQRDVFPLPPLTVEAVLNPRCCKVVRQRLHRRARIVAEANGVIDALNVLSGAVPSSGTFVRPSALEQSAQRSVLRQVAMAPHLVPCNLAEAVNELLASEPSYRGEEISSTVVDYDRALV